MENLRFWAHERTPGIPRNVDDLETVAFAEVLCSIAEDQHRTRYALRYVSQVRKRIKPNGTIRERLTKFWETKTWKKEDTHRKKLLEKPIYMNRCFYPVTQSQRKNVWHPGFVFLAELALRSDGYIETCDTYRKKHSCRCHVLLELHKTVSMPQRLFDAKDATTQSRDLKHTKYRHLDLVRSITKWESMCSRSLTQLTCPSQS